MLLTFNRRPIDRPITDICQANASHLVADCEDGQVLSLLGDAAFLGELADRLVLPAHKVSELVVLLVVSLLRLILAQKYTHT